jgi:cytoskeletal protein CcmA (bactofilin family)
MSLIKSKNSSISKTDHDASISKKFEVIGSNFKAIPTIIAKDLRVEGVINGSGVIEIEGYIKGLIDGNVITLRENGFVEGTIIAESVSIRGKFEGSLKAKSVSILGRAKVVGEIEYESLSVEDGACIDGQFKHVESKSDK